MGWLLAAFIVVPLLELYLLLRIGDHAGFLPTLAGVVVVGLIGTWLARRESRRVWRAWRESLERLQPPAEGVLDGVLVIAGGVLLITPGVITDVAGLALLIPFTRRLVAHQVRRYIDRRIADGRLNVVTFGGLGAAGPTAPGSGVVNTTGESLGDDAPASPRRPALPPSD